MPQLTDSQVKAALQLHSSVTLRQLPGTTKQVLEVDVPDNGHCLFYAVMLGFLFPVIRDEKAFQERYHDLFGNTKEQLNAASDLFELLKKYDGNVNFFAQQNKLLTQLGAAPLRKRVSSHLQEGGYDYDLSNVLVGDENESKAAARERAKGEYAAKLMEEHPELECVDMDVVDNLTDSVLQVAPIASPTTPEQYYRALENNMFGGELEIMGFADLLQTTIIVFEKDQNGRLVQVVNEYVGQVSTPRSGEETDARKIYLLYTASAEGGKNDHYHCLLEPQSFHPDIVQDLARSPSHENLIQELQRQAEDNSKLEQAKHEKPASNQAVLVPEAPKSEPKANPVSVPTQDVRAPRAPNSEVKITSVPTQGVQVSPVSQSKKENPNAGAYIKQYRRQEAARDNAIILTAVVGVLLPLISWPFLIWVWIRTLKNEPIQTIVATDDEMEQVKQKRNTWKKAIKLAQCEPEPSLSLEDKVTIRKVPFGKSEGKNIWLVDRKKANRYRVFSRDEVPVTWDAACEHDDSKLKSVNIVKGLKQ